MSTYNGKNAIVEAGDPAVRVGKVRSISINASVEVQEDQYLGEEGYDVTVGNATYEGSITYHHDPEDAGQNKLQLGETVKLTVYPQGNVVGKEKREVTVIITEDPFTLEPSTKVEKQVSFRVQGAPVKSLVSAP